MPYKMTPRQAGKLAVQRAKVNHKCDGIPCSKCCGCGCKLRKWCRSCGHMMGHCILTAWGWDGGCKPCGKYMDKLNMKRKRKTPRRKKQHPLMGSVMLVDRRQRPERRAKDA